MPDSSTSRVKEVPLAEDPIQRAIDYGIDISLLEVNLSKTPIERVEQHDARLNEVLDLQHRVAAWKSAQ
jgi:hypothetical protein